MKGIVVIAVCVVAAMVAVKDGRILHSTGLTATCSKVATTPAADIEACKAGKLEGKPDLTKRGCKFAGVVRDLQYWRCPSETQPDG